MRALVITFCLVLLLCGSTRAETWTNQAGHVLTATLMAIEGDQILLQNTNGRTWRLPLSSLKPADQERARGQSGTEKLPSELAACFTQAQEDIRRAAQFLHGGRITSEAYAARCQTITERFDHLGQKALKAHNPKTDRALLKHLKQRLAEEQQSAANNPPSGPQAPPR